jgi:4'-phosphopantetheinyl transferase
MRAERPAETWVPAPGGALELAGGCVHVWRCGLRPPDDARDLERRLPLDSAELERVARYRRPVDGLKFALGRSFMKRTLARYLGIPVASLALDADSNGKPHIAQGVWGSELSFNLSHSGELALLAVSQGLPLGIDLEHVHPIDRLERLIVRCMTREERHSLKSYADDELLDGFFRFWTRKEAFLKGLGSGLTRDPARASVLHPDRPTLLPDDSDSGEPRPVGWSIIDLEPADGYMGALAVQGSIAELRMFDVAVRSVVDG